MPEASPPVDLHKLRVALAERELPAWKLAHRLGMSGAYFSQILHQRSRTPPKFAARIERVLGLEPGALAVQEEDGPVKPAA